MLWATTSLKKDIYMMTHLDNLHLRQGEAAGAHGHSTVTWGWLDTAVVISVRLVAGVTNHINFICKENQPCNKSGLWMTPVLPLCTQYWYKHRHQCVIVLSKGTNHSNCEAFGSSRFHKDKAGWRWAFAQTPLNVGHSHVLWNQINLN